MHPWNRWLEKGFGARPIRRLVCAIEELVERRPVRVAHVEDDATDALLAARALRRKDCSITRFASYDEGKKALVDGDISQYDCVMLDVMLPAGREGERLAGLIRNASREIPIVMFTNLVEPDRAMCG